MSVEGSDIVEAAINKALPTMEGYDENDILMDWVVVAYVDNPNEEAGGGYPMLFSNGDMPIYKAVGLLSTGISKLEFIEED